MATTASVVFGRRTAATGSRGTRRGRPGTAAERGELAADAVAGTPQLARRRIDGAAAGVEHDERGDGDAARRARRSPTRCRPSAPRRGRPCRRRSCPGGPPRRLRRRRARCPNSASGRLVEVAACAEVEDHGGGHDRHDLVPGSAPIWKPRPLLPPATPSPRRRRRGRRRCRREADGVDVADHVHRVEQVGLAGARSAATHVDAADGARRWETTVVPVSQPRPRRWWWPTATPSTSVMSLRGPAPHAASRRRNRSAASTYTSAWVTRSATSTNSSAWWAIHFPPGP